MCGVALDEAVYGLGAAVLEPTVIFMLVPHGHEVLGRIVGENAHEQRLNFS